MAILFRNLSDLTIGGMTARLTVCSGDNDRIRVEIAPYDCAVTTAYTGALNVTVTYNGESKTLSANPFTRSVSAFFTSVYWAKSITVSSPSGIVCGGTAVSPWTVSWKGDGIPAAPEIAVTYYSGLRTGRTASLQWTVTGVPEGYRAYTVGVWLYRAPKTQVEPEYVRSCLIGEKTGVLSLQHTISDLVEENVVFYRIGVALYPEDGAETASRDDYVLYREIDSPVYVCTDETVYRLAPYDFRCSAPGENRVINMTWKVLATATETKGFLLEYSVDGSVWTEIFWNTCASCSWSFTVPEGLTRIAFRLRSYSTRSRYEQSNPVYTPWIDIGKSNVYVGHRGSVVTGTAVYIGSGLANAVLRVI